MTWTDEALCKDSDIDFFPETAFPAACKEAIALCAICPVKDPCLQYAIDSHPGVVGIWGGKLFRLSSQQGRRRPPHVYHRRIS